MLKIADTERGPQALTLQLEGQVIGPWVDELRRSCEAVLARGAWLTLDLTGVSFVDRNGIELLLGLRRQQVALRNCSGFVKEQLSA